MIKLRVVGSRENGWEKGNTLFNLFYNYYGFMKMRFVFGVGMDSERGDCV